MWKWGLRIGCVLIAGLLSYNFGSFLSSFPKADAAFISSQLGMKVGDIVDPVTACPSANLQLILESENTDRGPAGGEQWNWMSCNVSSCVTIAELHSGVTTVCPSALIPSNCTPSTITGTIPNVYQFNFLTDAYIGSGTSTSLGVPAAPDDECVDADGHCAVMWNAVYNSVYDRHYFADMHVDTFAPKKLSICSLQTSFPAITDNCVGVSGFTNSPYFGLAIDDTTDSLFFHQGSFSDQIDKFPITSGVVGNVSASITGLSLNQINFALVSEPLAVEPGGNVYVARENGTSIDIVELNQSLVELTSFASGLVVFGERFSTLLFNTVDGFLYACGGSLTGDVAVSKFSTSGVIMATNLLQNIGSTCTNMRVSAGTGKVYVATLTGGVNQLNGSTLAVESFLDIR